MSSPPQHAAPSTLPDATSTAQKRTRATPSPPQKKPKQKRRARVTVEPDETTQVSGQDRHRLPLADADAYYIPDFVDPLTAQRWHDELLKLEECEPTPASGSCPRGAGLAAETVLLSLLSTRPLSLSCCPECTKTGYQPTLKIYGKPVTQSRKIAAFATDPSLDVKYSGTTVRMSYDYPPLLREIQDLVEAKLNVKFNHVMLNLYENGRALFPSLPLGASPDEKFSPRYWQRSTSGIIATTEKTGEQPTRAYMEPLAGFWE